LGGAWAALASLLFGAIVVWGKQLLERGIEVDTMLTIRFGIGALVLFVALLWSRRPLLAEPGERVGLGLLALFGYAVEATFFFSAAEHGTAAAVTLLFFTYPVFVTLWTWLIGGRPPTRRTVMALACAVVGAAVVVGTGAGLAIERIGVAFALGAAVTYSGYLTGADFVLRRTNALTSAMWVSAGASLGLFLYSNAVGHWRLPEGAAEWGPLVGMGLASGGAFFFLMAAVQRIGAVRTAIISAIEPLAASLLAYVFLDELVTLGVAIGGVLILVGAVMASIARAATPQEQQIP
jgi:drug/metabolite transporter (DMT)-like permease